MKITDNKKEHENEKKKIKSYLSEWYAQSVCFAYWNSGICTGIQ